VKWSEHPTAGDAGAFGEAEKALRSGRVARKTVVCRAPNAYPIAGDVTAVPVDKLAEAIEGAAGPDHPRSREGPDRTE
jgi:hypothetical protein